MNARAGPFHAGAQTAQSRMVDEQRRCVRMSAYLGLAHVAQELEAAGLVEDAGAVRKVQEIVMLGIQLQPSPPGGVPR